MSDYWHDKRVVLLGGAALIGSHLAKALLALPIASLKVVDDMSSGALDNLQYLGMDTVYDVKTYVCDLRVPQCAEDAVRRSDVVFHLAAQHGGRGYVENPNHRIALYDNAALDATIFRACAKMGVGKVVYSSSACAYPINLQKDTSEILYLKEDMIDYNDWREADGEYGNQKLYGERMLDAYVSAGEFKGVSTRSFTVYGPLMKENHAIAALIAKVMIKQNPIEVWGNGSQIRNWTYVTDNVSGALLAAEHIDRGAANIGVEARLTPIYAVNKICDIMEWWPDSVLYQREKPTGPVNRVADASKLKALGWTPKYTFEEGLRKTINWYLSTHTAEEVRKDFERKLTER